ncbi:MAG: hypothetical protein ACRDHX_13765 [Chloroflexota bacterium]
MDQLEIGYEEDTAQLLVEPCGCSGYRAPMDTGVSSAVPRQPSDGAWAESRRESAIRSAVDGTVGLPLRVSAADARVEQVGAVCGRAYADLAATLVTPRQRRLLLDYADAEAESAAALADEYVQRLIAHAGSGLGPFLRGIADQCLSADACRCWG